MTFKKSVKKLVHSKGNTITLRHHQRPYSKIDAKITSNSPKQIAKKYLSQNRTLIGISKDLASSITDNFIVKFTNEGQCLKLAVNKLVKNTRTLGYQYTYLGIPVWKKGVNVRMYDDRKEIVSSSNTIGRKVSLPYLGIDEKKLSNPSVKKKLSQLKSAITKKKKSIPALLKKWAKSNKFKFNKVVDQKLIIFPFERENVLEGEHECEGPSRHQHIKVDINTDGIKDGSYRLAIETFFEIDAGEMKSINWRIVTDVKTGEILYLRCSSHGIDGFVFPLDPERLSGDVTLTPASPATDLDPLRVQVELLGLDVPAAGDPQSLSGEYVTLSDFEAPVAAPPTEAVGDDFLYSSTSNNFAAVNAYYQMDILFRMVEDFGLDVNTYFGGTTFPIPVDHLANTTNAYHSGDDATGSTIRFGFGRIEASNIGYSTMRAACAHEFAHACLQNNISDGVFSFCHGFGDGLGVILCDPDSQATDRFARNPFMTIDAGTRRHDRDPSVGWAWGGSLDTNSNFRTRQIMSSSLFRAYQCTGGDSEHGNPAVQLDRRRFASRYMSFLLIGAVGTLTSVAPPTGAEDFETAIMDFDTTNLDFEGHPGGAFHKVVRWAFEKQGLHKLPGDPADGEGAAPEVDVYINDGRNGEYEYQRNFWNTTDIWSSQVNDSSVGHQTPIVGTTNYFFVKIKNRGQATANNIVVKAYQCMPGTGLVWPIDWTAMDTPELPLASLNAGDEAIVGPFEWTPTTIGHECVLASVSCDEDSSNADTVLGDIPHWRLVPFDNNIAQRNVSPEEADADSLAESMRDRFFWVNNPYDRSVTAEIDIDLPDFLKKRDWGLKITSQGSKRFKLPPKGRRKVSFSIVKGSKFFKKDIPKKGADIDITTYIDNQLVGGMTYKIDPKFKRNLEKEKSNFIKNESIQSIKDLINCSFLHRKESA